MYGTEKCMAFAHMSNDELLKRMSHGRAGGTAAGTSKTVGAKLGNTRAEGVGVVGAMKIAHKHHKHDVYKNELEREEALLKEEREKLRQQKLELQRVKQQQSAGARVGGGAPTRLNGVANTQGGTVNPEYEKQFEKYGAVHCPPGRYNKAVTCEPCESGKFQRRYAYVAKGEKKQGYTRVPADTQGKAFFCTVCPGGKYQMKRGAVACRECEVGQYRKGDESGTDGGSTMRMQGVPAVAAAAGARNRCRPCPLGKYQNRRGQKACISLPSADGNRGGYASGTNSAGAAGVGAAAGAATAGVSAGGGAAVTCGAGRFVHVAIVSGVRMRACLDCPRGKYQYYPGADSCKVGVRHHAHPVHPRPLRPPFAPLPWTRSAPPAYADQDNNIYVDTLLVLSPGPLNHQLCRSGQFQPVQSSARCRGSWCPAGYYGRIGAISKRWAFCRSCPFGKYQPGMGEDACWQRPKGWSENGKGSPPPIPLLPPTRSPTSLPTFSNRPTVQPTIKAPTTEPTIHPTLLVSSLVHYESKLKVLLWITIYSGTTFQPHTLSDASTFQPHTLSDASTFRIIRRMRLAPGTALDNTQRFVRLDSIELWRRRGKFCSSMRRATRRWRI
jgi:hypothetical protein